MRFIRCGSLYLDPTKMLYAQHFLPEVKGPAPDDQGGLRLGFDEREITLYADEPGFAELLAWLDAHSDSPT